MSTVTNAASIFSPSQISTASSSSSSSTSSTAQAAGANASQQLAGNFNTFLQLLTTQLQNQNPLSPLDTNQFTQQLVEFASVEQQINMNTNLQSLITMQQTTEATSALQLVGSTITVGGNSATLSNATSTPAGWSSHHFDARDRRRHGHQLVRLDGLQRHVVAERRHPELHLERPGQQRPNLARRRLHAFHQGDRRQRTGGDGIDAGSRRRQRCQPQFQSADPEGQRPKRPDQPSYLDQPLRTRLPPTRHFRCIAHRNRNWTWRASRPAPARRGQKAAIKSLRLGNF